ncbi:MAG: PIN domain-containing protein [Spirochaetaceae bacterium]|nr:PIN domain-containing protein [Spirochaetaceae bacterium]
MILLDTNVLSELTRNRPAPQVTSWYEQHEPLLAVPTTALAELRFGIVRLPTGRRRSSLIEFWSKARDHFLGRIFSFDERAAATYGDLASESERVGKPIDIADGQDRGHRQDAHDERGDAQFRRLRSHGYRSDLSFGIDGDGGKDK